MRHKQSGWECDMYREWTHCQWGEEVEQPGPGAFNDWFHPRYVERLVEAHGLSHFKPSCLMIFLTARTMMMIISGTQTHGEPHLFTKLVGGRCGSAMSVARGWVEANRAKEGEAVSHPGLSTIADEGLSGRTGWEVWWFIFIGTLERREAWNKLVMHVLSIQPQQLLWPQRRMLWDQASESCFHSMVGLETRGQVSSYHKLAAKLWSPLVRDHIHQKFMEEEKVKDYQLSSQFFESFATKKRKTSNAVQGDLELYANRVRKQLMEPCQGPIG